MLLRLTADLVLLMLVCVCEYRARRDIWVLFEASD